MRNMSIPRGRPCKFRPALWTIGLRCSARLLALMSEEIAKGGELAAVAAVLPALGFGTLVEDADGVLAA